MGLPLGALALAGDVQSGALASLGALAALYAPGLPYRRRAVRVLGVGAGLVAAVVGGTAVVGSPVGTVAVIAMVTGIAVALTRRFSVAPPGALMPVLVCATATQIPLDAAPLAPRVGFVALGAAIAWLVVMVGAPFAGRTREAARPTVPAPPWDDIRRAAARGAVGTGAAALIALTLGLPRPDWAAVACAAVLVHDATRRTVRRAAHRAAGTAAGIAVAGVVLAMSAGVLQLVVLVIALQFVVELLVVRHYALAVVFITPLALLQGTLATGELEGPVGVLLAARLVETAVGCALAVAAQAVLPPRGEHPARSAVRRLGLRRTVPILT